MSQTPMTLQTPLAPKAFAWRRWLMILIVATLLSGGLWWAKETGRLASWLGSTIVNSTITTSTAGDGIAAEQQAVAPPSATNNTTAPAQSPAVANAPTTDLSQPMVTTTEQATQPASSTPNTTADTKAVEVVTAPRALVAVAGIAGVQLWNAEGQPVTTLDIGAKLQATARTADGQWLTVETEQGSGWAQAAQVVAFDLAELPVTDRTAPTITASAPSDAASGTTAAITQPVITEAQAPNTPATNERAADATTATAVTAVVATSGANLNVRSGPSTSDELVTKMANGATVTVSGRDESSAWVQIALSDNTADTGWIAAQYLQLDSPIDTLPVMTSN